MVLLLLLLAGGILFLRSPLGLILLPTLLWRFAAGQDEYWGPDWHYSAVLMPVLFLGLVDGVRSLRTSPRASCAPRSASSASCRRCSSRTTCR